MRARCGSAETASDYLDYLTRRQQKQSFWYVCRGVHTCTSTGRDQESRILRISRTGLDRVWPASILLLLHWIRLFLDLISKNKVVIIEHQHQHLPADRCVSFIISLCASLPFIESLLLLLSSISWIHADSGLTQLILIAFITALVLLVLLPGSSPSLSYILLLRIVPPPIMETLVYEDSPLASYLEGPSSSIR